MDKIPPQDVMWIFLLLYILAFLVNERDRKNKK